VLNAIDNKSGLASDKQILACVKIQKDIDEVDEKLSTAQDRLQELGEQVERVRETLSAVKDKAAGSKVDKWIEDLDASETEIRQINKTTLPDLQKKRKDLNTKLSSELKKLTLTWNESVK